MDTDEGVIQQCGKEGGLVEKIGAIKLAMIRAM